MRVKIEKLVFGGPGLGHLPNGQAVFVWNALPGEEVEFSLLKKKRDYQEGVATAIYQPSSQRLAPREGHFLSCSPWQILSPEGENEWKVKIATEVFQKQANFSWDWQLTAAPEDFGYRNKIEYSFAEEGDGIKLAFFRRGQKQREPLVGCALSQPVINRVAESILLWINKEKIPLRSLKSLIIRTGQPNQALAALFIKDRLLFDSWPEIDQELIGFKLYYSTHKCPAAVPTELLITQGPEYLEGLINQTRLRFGLLSFFQINQPVFVQALADIGRFLDKERSALDFYCGVGSISLPLADQARDWVLVESNEEASEYAQENIHLNRIGNCRVECAPAEKMIQLIDAEKTLVVDPPRSGLHPKVLRSVLEQKPPQVMYLSCDLATQARDLAQFLPAYEPVFARLYNFFPRTPHVESLVILKKK
ncbi:MAG TPA: TRAM domain-containing protein [Patescibacteria group bacterium]|nr:TRAM domain-containing protein [Patescibacteria group bacterium]